MLSDLQNATPTKKRLKGAFRKYLAEWAVSGSVDTDLSELRLLELYRLFSPLVVEPARPSAIVFEV